MKNRSYLGDLTDKLKGSVGCGDNGNRRERGSGCGTGCLLSFFGLFTVPFGVLRNLTKRYGGKKK